MTLTVRQVAASLLALAVLVGLLAASHGHLGAAASMDSLTYLNVARAVADGQGVVAPDHTPGAEAFAPMTLWPPLYPVLLSVMCPGAECSPEGIRQLVPVLNGLLLMLTAGLFFALCRALVTTPVALLVTAALVILPAFQIMFLFVWSETLFLPLLLAALLCQQRYLAEAHWPWLVAALLLVALATYTRYTGVAFAFGLVLGLLLSNHGTPLSRLRMAMLAGSAYVGLVTPLLLRNLAHSGHLSGGERGLPGVRIVDDSLGLLWQLANELFLALPPLALAWLLAVVVVIVLGLRRSGTPSPDSPGLQDWGLPLLWAACYLGFLLVSRSLQRVDLDTRMLGVVLPFLVLAVVALTAWLRTSLPVWLASTPLAVLLICAALGGLYTHNAVVTNLRSGNSPGYLNGMHYYSVTEPRFDVFPSLADRYVIDSRYRVVTDIPRPQILSYFYPRAQVKSLPQRQAQLDPERLKPMLDPGLLVILHSPARQREFLDFLESQGEDFRVAWATNSGVRYLVADIPPVAK